MKDILSSKRQLGEFETVALADGCTTMLTNKLPPMLKDPGSFTMPCSIGNQYVGKALCDLGVSINLVPMSMFKKLRIGKAKPTTVTLKLADRSYARTEGKIEDVLVRVDKFIFPTDLIVFDCEANKDVPIILGRHFLSTGRTVVDVQKGELTMRVNDQQITINVFQALKCADDIEESHVVSLLDFVVEEEFKKKTMTKSIVNCIQLILMMKGH
ncbi:uncharacterized protein LOC105767284 [Gossypium raimondii]|uniref:uncharacterized protein LOC105767284 n=1 Tax=Gossypium raimondii TaxID=29730 RepID=UPI00063A9D5E|nr:uncharacterized protein LOC105767284 [Gossypium raimondii]